MCFCSFAVLCFLRFHGFFCVCGVVYCVVFCAFIFFSVYGFVFFCCVCVFGMRCVRALFCLLSFPDVRRPLTHPPTPLRILPQDTRVTLPPGAEAANDDCFFYLAGVSDYESSPDYSAALDGRDDGVATVLLAHQPTQVRPPYLRGHNMHSL